MLKGIHQEAINLYFYVPNNTAWKCRKQKQNKNSIVRNLQIQSQTELEKI